jgi:hypothetical protein
MDKDVVKIINEAKMMDLIDEDGTKYNLESLPGLTESELDELEKNFPCKIDPDVINTLTITNRYGIDPIKKIISPFLLPKMDILIGRTGLEGVTEG